MSLLPWKREARPEAQQAADFDDLALPLLPSLYNVARWLCRNPVEAEDLVQETFLKALRGYSAFQAGTNFKAWIFRILRNTYLTSRSGLAVQHTVALEDEIAASGEPDAAIDHLSPEMHLLRMSDRAALQSAMEKLSPPLLEAILLCDVEEMKYKDIAVVLDIPIGTVMSRITRARRALRFELESRTSFAGGFRI